ncbi:hypothetical protein B0H19DRAFT_1233063 [Mycena capillaripes]|nr:hypothetical protein B0H19DRAFT_1233063 [Mycena capillaripes]
MTTTALGRRITRLLYIHAPTASATPQTAAHARPWAGLATPLPARLLAKRESAAGLCQEGYDASSSCLRRCPSIPPCRERDSTSSSSPRLPHPILRIKTRRVAPRAAHREVLTATKVEYICPAGQWQLARASKGAVPPATCRRPPSLFSPFPAPTLGGKTWKQAAALSGRPDDLVRDGFGLRARGGHAAEGARAGDSDMVDIERVPRKSGQSERSMERDESDGHGPLLDAEDEDSLTSKAIAHLHPVYPIGHCSDHDVPSSFFFGYIISFENDGAANRISISEPEGWSLIHVKDRLEKCERFESKTVISPNTEADPGVSKMDLRMITAGS